MITLEDCIGMCGLTEEEVLAVAEHEHLPEVARELPRFVSEVRRMFTPDEIAAHLAQIERAQTEKDFEVPDEDDPFRESPAATAERVRRFNLIKELLTATILGT